MDASSIPKPQVLDSGPRLRNDRERQFTQDPRARAELVDIALDEGCGYEQLWNDLSERRKYLAYDPQITDVATSSAPERQPDCPPQPTHMHADTNVDIHQPSGDPDRVHLFRVARFDSVRVKENLRMNLPGTRRRVPASDQSSMS